MRLIPCPLCESTVMSPVVRVRRGAHEYQCVRCNDCGFHYVNPEPGADELTAFYAKEYQTDHQHVWHGLEDAANRYMIRLIKRRGIRSLVDLGSGQGRFVYMARAAGLDASGIELMAENVTAAERLYGGGLRQNSVSGYLAEKPRDIECLTILNVFEHLPGPLDIARQMHDALRPGGHLVVIVPDVSFTLTLGKLRGMLGLKDRYMLESPRFSQQGFLPPVHLSSFDAPHLRLMLEKAGFAIAAMRQAPVVGTVKPVMSAAKHAVYFAGRVLETVTAGAIHWGYSLLAVARRPRS